MLCVLCQAAEATTREHRVKASALRRLLKGDAYHFKTDNIEGARIAQGPKSKILQFQKFDLCSDCNNRKSRFADLSFEKFDLWVQSKAIALTQESPTQPGSIKLEPDEDQAEAYLGTICYLAKFLICKLNEGELKIPEILRDLFFLRRPLRKHVSLTIQVERVFDFNFIEVGPLMAALPRNETNDYLKSHIAEWYEIFVRHGKVKYMFRVDVPS